MNKKTSAIIVIVVLVLIVLFGVGEFFANPSQTAENAPTGTSTVPAVVATQVVAYVPPTPASSTPVEQGSCWTNSIAAGFRTDAWRCSVGNSISDPCFQIPGSNNLLCDVNPANPAATSSFVLQLTQPLPPPVTIPPGQTPSNWAWLIELSDGTLCSPFTGTLPFAQGGVSANYGCAPTTPGGEGLYIFGGLNNSDPQWTAEVGLLSAATSTLPIVENSSTVSVAEVWQ